ncbi:MAG: hypothetical protein RL189_1594 [Pseudomonadota bacterium]
MHFKTVFLVLLILVFVSVSAAKAQFAQPIQSGWNVLGDAFLTPSQLDGITFEWQYFMIHDKENKFTGSIGYVLADPRGHLGKTSNSTDNDRWMLPVSLMPSGASVAIGGRWAGDSRISNYHRYSKGFSASHLTKDFSAQDEDASLFAKLTEQRRISANEGLLRLEGRTNDFAWDLNVTPDWIDSNSDESNQPFGPLSGRDVGYLPGENWTVHMQWPRTHVEGTLVNRRTGEELSISGHGYRENAWGRWNFAVDGWAFSVLSDEKSKVQWAWQSYHKSRDMDWLDVRFDDSGVTKRLRLFAKENQLRWNLKDWTYDSSARQCVPNTVEVVGLTNDYEIRAHYSLADGHQQAMISDATPLTRAYVIMVHTPLIQGTIRSRKNGNIITSFQGQGGGEFSFHRNLVDSSGELDCGRMEKHFSQEYAPVKGIEFQY